METKQTLKLIRLPLIGKKIKVWCLDLWSVEETSKADAPSMCYLNSFLFDLSISVPLSVSSLLIIFIYLYSFNDHCYCQGFSDTLLLFHLASQVLAFIPRDCYLQSFVFPILSRALAFSLRPFIFCKIQLLVVCLQNYFPLDISAIYIFPRWLSSLS